MRQLNFPPFQMKIKDSQNRRLIYDMVRKKYITLTPEEWVRQHCLHYLLTVKKYRASYTKVEYAYQLSSLQKRADILIFDTLLKPFILVECKAPTVQINQKTLDQINRYNTVLNAPYLFLTNGLTHFFCGVDTAQKQWIFLPDLPDCAMD